MGDDPANVRRNSLSVVQHLQVASPTPQSRAAGNLALAGIAVGALALLANLTLAVQLADARDRLALLDDRQQRTAALIGTSPTPTPTPGSGGGGSVSLLDFEALQASVAALQVDAGRLVPPGTVLAFAGQAVPQGFLACDGQAVDRAQYAALFAAVAQTFGAGDGTSTFNVPDLRGRVAVGLDSVASPATRVTLPRLDGATLGAAGGSENYQQHTHAVSDPGHTHSYTRDFAGGGNIYSAASGNQRYNQSTGTTVSSGTGISIELSGSGQGGNLPPSLVVNYIIKY